MRILFFIPILLLACNNSEKEYIKSVEEFRAMKNENFRKGGSSPLSKKEIWEFKGLSYFNVDSKYKFEAKFTSAKIPEYRSLFESEQVKQIHVVRGKLLFEINSKVYCLTAYSSAGQAQHSLFVPFVDTHKNSYPGGRYVDGKLLNDSICLLDFNLSYNPYCVYNEKYTCAVVPKENWLEVAIPAGEKWEN